MHTNIQNIHYINGSTHIVVNDWLIKPGQHWVVFSSYSHSGSTLGAILAGVTACENKRITGLPASIGWLSLQSQQALLEEVIANDDSEALKQADPKQSVEGLVLANCKDSQQLAELLQLCDLCHIRTRAFRHLSTGETRRVMLARALALSPQLLILDEPYAGLDAAHQASLSALLNDLSTRMQIIIITSRDHEIPACITHVTMFNYEVNRAGHNVHTLGAPMSIEQWHSHPVMAHLTQLSTTRSDELISFIKRQRHQTVHANPLVDIKNGKVAYGDSVIFKDVNWQVCKGEHWQIRGPNGCGKSTLLGLILGDHPQCYSNDITLFGRRRGSGETIWDVKQQIGIVSSALHLQYRVNCSALDVLLSGFFDSIGVYQKASDQQVNIAKDWLAILHMSSFETLSFKQLDYGQQRLLIIGRALIKQPALLILDEPYQGLDFINRKLVMNTLNMIAQENLSQLLYVSHHADDALPAIQNYIDFVGEAQNGYELIVTPYMP